MQELVNKLGGIQNGGHMSVSADFFFAKGQRKRGDAGYLFSTIAYQLAMNIPGLRELINDAMSADLTLPKKTLEVQLQALILTPLLTMEKYRPLPVMTVLIDRLDKCEGYQNQQAVLQLICNTFAQYDIPFRFMIASRPEIHIRETFRCPQLAKITRHIVLDDSFDLEKDIKVYLLAGFADIYKRKSSLFLKTDYPWPAKDVRESLLERASGQFIFAATVLKFVDSPFTHPKTQLELLYNYHDTQGLSEIDRLYTQILSMHPNRELLMRILEIVVAPRSGPSFSVIDDFLHLESGTSKITLQGLTSLLEGLGSGGTHPNVLHASFREYLLNEGRSGRFFVDGPRV